MLWGFCLLQRRFREWPLHRQSPLDPKLKLFLYLCPIPILGILLHDRTRLIIFLLTFFHYGITFPLELLPSHSRKSQRSHGQRKNHGQTETCSTVCFSPSRAIPNPFGSALVPASSESLPRCRLRRLCPDFYATIRLPFPAGLATSRPFLSPSGIQQSWADRGAQPRSRLTLQRPP